MGLGPKQMQESIVRNLKDKTGKDLSEWISILQSQDIEDGKLALNYLKIEHHLGHFQAKVIADLSQGQNEYENPDSFADLIFDTAKTKALFSLVKDKILALGDDVKEQPCKTYIPYYRKHQFSRITRKKDSILLGLNLPEDYINDLVEPTKNGNGDRINGQILIDSQSDWNSGIAEVLEVAYKNN